MTRTNPHSESVRSLRRHRFLLATDPRLHLSVFRCPLPRRTADGCGRRHGGRPPGGPRHGPFRLGPHGRSGRRRGTPPICPVGPVLQPELAGGGGLGTCTGTGARGCRGVGRIPRCSTLGGTFESDRRYGEKLLQILPGALHHSIGRPAHYTNALAVAQNLGELEAYRAILMEHHGSRPDDQVLLHHLGAAQVTLANLTDENRSRTLKDSLEAVLDELAARHDENPDAKAPVLYRLAAGYNLLGREEKKNHWLARLEAAPDRGVLADDLRYRNRYFAFQNLLRGPSR